MNRRRERETKTAKGRGVKGEREIESGRENRTAFKETKENPKKG